MIFLQDLNSRYPLGSAPDVPGAGIAGSFFECDQDEGDQASFARVPVPPGSFRKPVLHGQLLNPGKFPYICGHDCKPLREGLSGDQQVVWSD